MGIIKIKKNELITQIDSVACTFDIKLLIAKSGDIKYIRIIDFTNYDNIYNNNVNYDLLVSNMLSHIKARKNNKNINGTIIICNFSYRFLKSIKFKDNIDIIKKINNLEEGYYTLNNITLEVNAFCLNNYESCLQHINIFFTNSNYITSKFNLKCNNYNITKSIEFDEYLQYINSLDNNKIFYYYSKYDFLNFLTVNYTQRELYHDMLKYQKKNTDIFDNMYGDPIQNNQTIIKRAIFKKFENSRELMLNPSIKLMLRLELIFIKYNNLQNMELQKYIPEFNFYESITNKYSIKQILNNRVDFHFINNALIQPNIIDNVNLFKFLTKYNIKLSECNNKEIWNQKVDYKKIPSLFISELPKDLSLDVKNIVSFE